MAESIFNSVWEQVIDWCFAATNIADKVTFYQPGSISLLIIAIVREETRADDRSGLFVRDDESRVVFYFLFLISDFLFLPLRPLPSSSSSSSSSSFSSSSSSPSFHFLPCNIDKWRLSLCISAYLSLFLSISIFFSTLALLPPSLLFGCIDPPIRHHPTPHLRPPSITFFP